MSSSTAKQGAATLLYGFPKNTEITEKAVNAEEALGRVQKPIQSVEVNIEVYGTYGLPAAWKQKIVSYRK